MLSSQCWYQCHDMALRVGQRLCWCCSCGACVWVGLPGCLLGGIFVSVSESFHVVIPPIHSFVTRHTHNLRIARLDSAITNAGTSGRHSNYLHLHLLLAIALIRPTRAHKCASFPISSVLKKFLLAVFIPVHLQKPSHVCMNV